MLVGSLKETDQVYKRLERFHSHVLPARVGQRTSALCLSGRSMDSSLSLRASLRQHQVSIQAHRHTRSTKEGYRDPREAKTRGRSWAIWRGEEGEARASGGRNASKAQLLAGMDRPSPLNMYR